MTHQSSKLVLFLMSSLAVSIGCSSDPATSNSGTGGSGGSGATGGGSGSSEGIALTPSDTGYIDGTKNSLGIVGSWYAYADSLGDTGMPPGKCQSVGKHMDSECAVVMTPTAGSFPNTGGMMCTTGKVEKVLDIVGMAGTLDYSNMWGAGIGFDLNNDGIAGKKTFDAQAANVVGFSFDLSAKPAAGLRVEVQTVPTDNSEPGNDYWGATSSYPVSPVVVGNNVVMWGDVKAPKGGHDLAVTQIEGIQFHVPSGSAAGTFDYCISNVKMLKK